MRSLFNGFVFFLVTSALLGSACRADVATSSKAANQSPVVSAYSSASSHLVTLNSDLHTDNLVSRGAELPPLLSPVDSGSQIDRSAAEAPQNISVEAVPTPTAISSGLLVLGGLAVIRIYRRLRLA